MTKEKKRFTLRIDSDLFATIKQQAEKNKRAIGSEIEFILEKEMRKK